jgi:membrane protease YdiL (CAAX protease family)
MNDLESTPHESEQNIFVAPTELFQSWSQPEAVPTTRIPHLGHLCLLVVFLLAGFMCMMVLLAIAMHFHLDGVSTEDQIKTNVHYLLGTEAVLYLVTLALSIPLFSLFWKKSFFTGIHWRGRTVLQLRNILLLPAISMGCIVLAGLDQWLLPGPEHAPIVDIIRSPGAAWLMFGFGVAIAPFCEEIFFRGFMLPALATACDWIGEYVKSENKWIRPALIIGSALASSTIVTIYCAVIFGGTPYKGIVFFLLFCFIALVFGMAFFWVYLRYQTIQAGLHARPLDANGHPQWSIFAMVIASIVTSLPFALMHGEQTGYSLGPFLQVFAVSIVLCAVRLVTRSLAASTLVHACYNFLLFSAMLIGTGGFRHFDKM